MVFDVWNFFAGLGLFLYGMSQLEGALKQLAGRAFKLFLKRHTKNKVKAILSGALVTGVLQSSSVVTLIVLGFVGAGILNMRSAFAVVLGSNLGTTFDSWFVAALGFKFDTDTFALPLIALSGACLLAFQSRQKIQLIARLAMGIGLLFLGLGFMKNSFEVLAKTFDLAKYAHLNNLSFVLIGFVITALIQSSSATMIIVLSALNAGAILFVSAAAVVIGAELGTSIKGIPGAAGPVAEKKKVAYSNIAFNFCIVILAFLFLHPIIYFVKDLIGISDPLIALVLFQSLINLGGIILFYPFLEPFSNLMDRLFKRKRGTATHFVYDDRSYINETFVELMEKEVHLFLHRVLHLNASAFGIDSSVPDEKKEIKEILSEERDLFSAYAARYAHIKQAEGEILSANSKAMTEKEEAARLNQLTGALRNAMYAAKGVKDLQQDIEELKNSANDIKFSAYSEMRGRLERFYKDLATLLDKDAENAFSDLSDLMTALRKEYEEHMNRIYKNSGTDHVKDADISTLLNVNRELYSSGKSMIHALKNYLLDPAGVTRFENAFGIGF